MILTDSSRRARRSGFTIIEIVLGVTILAILARMLITATDSIGSLTEVGNIEAHLANESEDAIRQIMSDLRMSGFQDDINGRGYPYEFANGAASGPFAQYSYVPAPQSAGPGDPDFGVHEALVVCAPSDLDANDRPEIDADADGIPELDGNGDGTFTDDPADVDGLWDPAIATIDADSGLVWSHRDVAYVVTQGPTGENELVRLVDGGNAGREVVARSVERMQVDFSSDPSADMIPGSIDSVRVRLYFRTTDTEGRVYRTTADATVRLKNSL